MVWRRGGPQRCPDRVSLVTGGFGTARPEVRPEGDVRRRLGRTSLMVTPVCIGGSPIGSMPQVFGEEVDLDRALQTVRRVFDGSINFLDTSNAYSQGESERRIGMVIDERGGLPPGFVLASKVDPDPSTGDFNGERVRRSADESLERLHLDRFQLLYLHDPERIGFSAAMAPGGPVEALVSLREGGVASYIGVAGGPVETMRQFIGTGAFDVLLTHNRFTLVDRSAEPLITQAAAAYVGVVNAAVFGGGILAKGTSRSDRYAYRTASTEVLDRVKAMEEACKRYSVPLRAAALGLSVRDPRVTSTVVGTATPAHVDDLVAQASAELPAALWEELAALVPPEQHWLG
jgi:D-threo-aldose 1-dehydrogenase